MISIDKKPCVTVTTHRGVISLDKNYEVTVDKIVTSEGYSYHVDSGLNGDEKRIVEAAVKNHLEKHGI